MDHLCFGVLTSWLSFLMFNYEVVTFPLVNWCLIVSIPDVCLLFYFVFLMLSRLPGLSHPFLGMGQGPMELGKLAAF